MWYNVFVKYIYVRNEMATQRLYPQTIICIIWDFDGTLVPGYMQQPLFDEYGIDASKFWKEVNQLPNLYEKQGLVVSKDTVYLNHILTYIEHSIFKGLTNKKLKELGGKLQFYPGLPKFLGEVKEHVNKHPEFSKHGIKVEHYIVSTGLKPMIEGSPVRQYVDGIWACEFIEDVIPPGFNPQAEMDLEGVRTISQIGYTLDNTTKTRAIFEINKGTNDDPRIDVNASIPLEHRRVPFPHMIYIADGPSDIPCFSLINHFHGKTYAVYDRKNKKNFTQVFDLNEQDRVQAFGEADYSQDSQTYMWIMHAVESIATQIVSDRTSTLKFIVHPPPNHITPTTGNGLSEETSELVS